MLSDHLKNIGSIRWLVYRSYRKLFLTRVELVGTSPGGRQGRWKTLDVDFELILKGQDGHAATPEIAVLNYQKNELFMLQNDVTFSLNSSGILDLILEAEKLLGGVIET